MKAIEYYEKYKSLPEDTTGEVAKKLFLEMSDEVITIARTRNTQSYEAEVSVIKEINKKWNAVARKFEAIQGKPILIQDGFIAFWKTQLPKQLKNI